MLLRSEVVTASRTVCAARRVPGMDPPSAHVVLGLGTNWPSVNALLAGGQPPSIGATVVVRRSGRSEC